MTFLPHGASLVLLTNIQLPQDLPGSPVKGKGAVSQAERLEEPGRQM